MERIMCCDRLIALSSPEEQNENWKEYHTTGRVPRISVNTKMDSATETKTEGTEIHQRRLKRQSIVSTL